MNNVLFSYEHHFLPKPHSVLFSRSPIHWVRILFFSVDSHDILAKITAVTSFGLEVLLADVFSFVTGCCWKLNKENKQYFFHKVTSDLREASLGGNGKRVPILMLYKFPWVKNFGICWQFHFFSPPSTAPHLLSLKSKGLFFYVTAKHPEYIWHSTPTCSVSSDIRY